MECARLLEEAQERSTLEDAGDGEGPTIYATLADEFKDEISRLDGAPNVGVTLDSLYTRTTAISGTPLRDSFHFGQTIVNDLRSSLWNGFNNVSGLTTLGRGRTVFAIH